MQDTGTWSFGGSADLFAGLTWDTRPDMTGSEASEDLQLAGVATIMAIQAELGGAVKNGNCFLVKGRLRQFAVTRGKLRRCGHSSGLT